MEKLTYDTFKQKVFDFENNSDWERAGTMPCIIHFYADWCGPCRMVEPILKEVASNYKDRIDIYCVNTEQEAELATAFNIQSLPSFLFVPVQDEPQMVVGAMPMRTFTEVIGEVLLHEEELNQSA